MYLHMLVSYVVLYISLPTDRLSTPLLPTVNATDYKGLLNKFQHLLRDGLAMSSRNTYAAGQGRYINFCKSAKVPAIPTTEYTLILFVTHLATANISQATIKIKVYL